MKKIKSGRIKIGNIKHIENSRMREKDDVSDLMQDIEQHGLLEPVGIRESDKALIFGNRRVKAYEKLGYEEIEADFFDDVSDEELLILNLSENIKRKKIGSIEIGRICNMLVERGMTSSEIAVKLGISKSRVRYCITAFKVTIGTPFETLIIEGRGGQAGKGIADGLIWKTQTSLSRALGKKITKQQWAILLRAMETGKLTTKTVSLLRGILMSTPDKDLNKALDVLDKAKIIYPVLAVNQEEWYKALRLKKISSDIEYIKYLINSDNDKILF